MQAKYELPPSLGLGSEMVRKIEDFDYTAGPEFSEETHPVELDPDRLEWGRLTDKLYEGRYKRFPPHMVMEESIRIFGKIAPAPVGQDQPEVKKELDLQKYGLITVHEITAEALLREHLSPDIIEVLLTDKRIEDNLQRFLIAAKKAFADVKGIGRKYGQWDREEAEHSNIAALILKTAGGMTQEALDEDYEMTQKQTWEPPFSTDIQMILYAMMQERSTRDQYMYLGNAMKRIGAVNSAFGMRLIGSDEGVHGDSYEKDAEAYARISPEKAVEAGQAAIYVAYNFRMPSLHLMRDRLADTKRSMDTVGYGIKEVKEMLRGALADLSFVPNYLIDGVVNAYEKAEPRRIAKILIAQRHEKLRASKSTGENGDRRNGSNGHDLILPEEVNGDHQDLILPSSGDIFTS